MKVNVDDLYILPPNPNVTKAYAEAVRSSKDHILDWFDMEEHVNAPIYQLSVELFEMAQRDAFFPAFLICTDEEVLGCFYLDPADDLIGVELSGWVRKGYEGEGIGSAIIRTAAIQAFGMQGHPYLVMRIDVANSASNRAAEKAGFKLDTTIETEKIGRKGTGRMNIWVKANGFPGGVPEDTFFPKEDIEPLDPSKEPGQVKVSNLHRQAMAGWEKYSYSEYE
jgi:RimJ/RimL family protein N-acetyltransferase